MIPPPPPARAGPDAPAPKVEKNEKKRIKKRRKKWSFPSFLLLVSLSKMLACRLPIKEASLPIRPPPPSLSQLWSRRYKKGFQGKNVEEEKKEHPFEMDFFFSEGPGGEEGRKIEQQ